MEKTETKTTTFKLGIAPPTTKFKFLEYNREINKANLKKIKESISKYGQIMPVMITNDDVIIDGQHRYIALKELGKDIVYVETSSFSVDDIDQINNTRRGWNNENRIKSLATRGFPEFVDLQKIIQHWRSKYPKIKHNTIINAFCGNNLNCNKSLLQNKTYQVDFATGTLILNYALACKNVLDQWYGAKFIEALKIVVIRNYDQFKIEKFVSKLEKNKFHMYNKTVHIVDEIYRIYNKGLYVKNRIQ
tara:strand:+ start:236 stop:976 length:741 start_codon:yes stop_codon:yes gene_type:complete